jgi:hypothetical protein
MLTARKLQHEAEPDNTLLPRVFNALESRSWTSTTSVESLALMLRQKTSLNTRAL